MAKNKRVIRFESETRILGCPLVSVACGPDASQKETRGWARGVVAVGDVATGVVAVGGVAGGGIAIGGLSCGLLSIGGVAIGGLVLAGVAAGFAAMGGVAVGHYARGGVAVGNYVVSPKQQDPEAVRFFAPVVPEKARR